MTILKQITWQKFQQGLWISLGVICLFSALVFWAITDKDHWQEVMKPAEEETEKAIEPEKVAATQHLGAMHDVVKPLETKRRVVVIAQHEPEFRGTKFVQDNKRKYSIELFRVGNESIIKSFLNKQSDRHQFSYLRLSGENQVEQYVLFYQLYDHASDAKMALEHLAVSLPKSVQPQVQALENYIPFVNDLGSDELQSSQKNYAVLLKPAAVPKTVFSSNSGVQEKTSPNGMNQGASTTATTITRRDAQGNVIDVQQSKTNVHQSDQGGTNVVQELTDPFN